MNPAKSSRSWQLRVQDIFQSIDKIILYLENITLSEFRKTGLIIDAVARNFEIIREASNHIPNAIKSQYPDIPWKEMKGMRNILIHEYFEIEADIAWYTAKKHLPKLKEQLENIPLG